MKFEIDDYSIEEFNKTKRADLDAEFSDVAPGKSIWFPNGVESNRARLRFYRWRHRTGAMIRSFEIKVGANDPRGAGFRLVFKEKKNGH